MNIENVGEKFNLEKFYDARSLAIKAVDIFNSKLKNGLSEPEGLTLLKSILDDLGQQRMWHPIKFRIGKNTVCSFRDKSEEGILLKKGDLYFIDIGPVFDGHEADYAKTFCFEGENKICQDVEDIFLHLKDKVYSDKLTGTSLYEYAQDYTYRLGYNFNPNMKGHRLSDFPHAIHFKKGLSDFESTPLKDRWILEVHIIDKNNRFGAFYEDLI